MPLWFSVCRELWTCEQLDLRGQPNVVSDLTQSLVAADGHPPVSIPHVGRLGPGSQTSCSVSCSLEPFSSSRAHLWMPPSQLWSALESSTLRAWAWAEGSSSPSTMQPRVSSYEGPHGEDRLVHKR